MAFPVPHGDKQRRNEKRTEREILVLRSTYSVVLQRAMWSEDVHGLFLTLVWSTHLAVPYENKSDAAVVLWLLLCEAAKDISGQWSLPNRPIPRRLAIAV